MKAIVTVVGKDQVGIIAAVCVKLAAYNVNVLDISQTVMQGYFTMMMVVDTSASTIPLAELAQKLEDKGKEVEKLQMLLCWLDLYDMISEGVLMPLGALVMSVLIGWVWKPKLIKDECELTGVKFWGYKYFEVCFKFVVPVVMAIVLYAQILDFFG